MLSSYDHPEPSIEDTVELSRASFLQAACALYDAMNLPPEGHARERRVREAEERFKLMGRVYERTLAPFGKVENEGRAKETDSPST